MNIRMEDCDEETLNRIADKSLPYLKAETLTPEIAAKIIEEEYIRQMIRKSENIIWPEETGKDKPGKKNKRKRRRNK